MLFSKIKENTTGYNHCKIEIPLPRRTCTELFDGLAKHQFDLFDLPEDLKESFEYRPPNLPDNLKRRYIRLLRSRADDLNFGYLNPATTSFKLLLDGADYFGIPFCERLLNILASKPTEKWIDVWHTY